MRQLVQAAILFPKALGFRDGATSVHTSRTMMVDELSLVMEKVAPDARANEYIATIVEENALGKPTRSTRQRTAKRLTELYALDPNCTLFRVLRHFWAGELAGRPMLAFLAAVARDPLLREATPFVLSVREGESVDADEISEHLRQEYPARFAATTLHSTAQNLASTWTEAGYLRGKVKKCRSRPLVPAVVAAFGVLLGYLCGFRGKLLLDSTWTRLLDRSQRELSDLMIESSREGWLNYKAAGSVVEITFPGLLKPNEEKAGNEQN